MKSSLKLRRGQSWLRKPVTDEERKESGPEGWAVLFVYLGDDRMLTVTEGELNVHKGEMASFFIWPMLERL